MIKGVQRQVIEICNTEHAYFERALLVVRADCTAEEAFLREQARQYLQKVGTCRFLRRRKYMRRVRAVLLVLGGAAAGAFVCLQLAG